jgi:hypothetical protein
MKGELKGKAFCVCVSGAKGEPEPERSPCAAQTLSHSLSQGLTRARTPHDALLLFRGSCGSGTRAGAG